MQLNADVVNIHDSRKEDIIEQLLEKLVHNWGPLDN